MRPVLSCLHRNCLDLRTERTMRRLRLRRIRYESKRLTTVPHEVDAEALRCIGSADRFILLVSRQYVTKFFMKSMNLDRVTLRVNFT